MCHQERGQLSPEAPSKLPQAAEQQKSTTRHAAETTKVKKIYGGFTVARHYLAGMYPQPNHDTPVSSRPSSSISTPLYSVAWAGHHRWSGPAATEKKFTTKNKTRLFPPLLFPLIPRSTPRRSRGLSLCLYSLCERLPGGAKHAVEEETNKQQRQTYVTTSTLNARDILCIAYYI